MSTSKTIKSIMAFLTAMAMTAGAMGITATAEENTTELTERQKQMQEWIDKDAPYSNGINGLKEFFYSNNLDRYASLMENAYEDGHRYCTIIYYYAHTEVKEAVEKYLKDTNDSGDWVFFNPVGENAKEQTEITDKDLILTMLIDFAEDPANEFTGLDNKLVRIRFSNRSKERIYIAVEKIADKEKIENFIKEKNIVLDKSIIWDVQEYADIAYENNHKAMVALGLETDDLGDANDDGKTNVRDCACIANALANGEAESLPEKADYNLDTRKNVRDAASLSKDLAEK